MRRRRLFVLPIAGLAAVAMPLAMAGSAGAQDAGEANGLRSVVAVLGTTVANVPNTPHSENPPGGQATQLGLPPAASPAATAAVLSTSAGPNGSAAAVANMTGVNGVVPGVASVLTADAITSECFGDDGSSSILNGALAGAIPLALAAPPNTTVPIPGVGSAIVNEQTTDDGVTVRAIHVMVNAGGIVVADIVVSESICFAVAQVAGATAIAGDPNLAG